MDNADRRNIHAPAACRVSGVDRQVPSRDRDVNARPGIALPQPGGESGSILLRSANGAKEEAFSVAPRPLPSSASASRQHGQGPHRPLPRYLRAAVDAGRRRAADIANHSGPLSPRPAGCASASRGFAGPLRAENRVFNSFPVRLSPLVSGALGEAARQPPALR